MCPFGGCVLCCKGTLEEKQLCCAAGDLLLDVAYGELISLTFQE